MTDTKNDMTAEITGSHDYTEYKKIDYPFGKYEVTIKLSINNEFIGIEQIRLNRDFAENEKERLPHGYHDVDKYYDE